MKTYFAPAGFLYGVKAGQPLTDFISYTQVESLSRNGDKILNADSAPPIKAANNDLHIAGILNCTPDSFSDGGLYKDANAAADHALQMIDQGATIIDIGGESTRPGATPITPQDEIARVLPVIKKLRNCKAKLSLDTRNAATMQAGLDEGVSIINDVTALTHDANGLKTVATSKADIILMHMQGTPQTMQVSPTYARVECDVYDYLEERITACVNAGIEKSRIIIDPGIGFGKTPAHNAALLRHIGLFHNLGVRIMAGASRKGFIPALTQPAPADQRLGGSLAAVLTAAQQGVGIIRVHDAQETRQAIALWRGLFSH